MHLMSYQQNITQEQHRTGFGKRGLDLAQITKELRSRDHAKNQIMLQYAVATTDTKQYRVVVRSHNFCERDVQRARNVAAPHTRSRLLHQKCVC